jgi:hypothetical protein
MLPVVVAVRMTVPSALPRVPVPILFRVVNVEIIRFEPPNAKICTLYGGGEISEIVLGDDCVRGILRAVLDSCKTSTPTKTSSDPF